MSDIAAPASSMSATERIRARYAIGLSGRYRTARRNHVVCLTHDEWERMVRDGLAIARRPTEPDGLTTYRLTRAGAEAALEPGETVPEDLIPAAMPA